MCSKKWLKYVLDIKGLLYICNGLYNFQKKAGFPVKGRKCAPL